jgi:uncharacterized membrane protein YphA (DoxX/SURF4 family)
MSEKDLRALLAYLRANAPAFPLAALRAQMAKAGHAPEDVERAVAVFEGRARPPEKSAWLAALAVALADLFLWSALFHRFGTGPVSCGGAVLLPIVYLVEIFGGLALLAGGRDRWGRALLLGVLLFLLAGLVILSTIAGKWLSGLSH